MIYSNDEWINIIKGLEDSNLSTKDYCAAKGVGTSTFYQKKRRLGLSNNPNNFMPVIFDIPVTKLSFELNGNHIEIDSSVDDASLKRIINAIK